MGVAALAYPTMFIQQNYQTRAFRALLIPSDKLPKTSADTRAHAAELVAKYPHDPRPHFIRAADLLDVNDPVGAEREARAGLAEEKMWHSLLSPQLGDSLRVVLAIAIDKDRHDEALQTARPACAAVKDGPMRKLLDDRKLCGT
jgi:rhomboid protease GluP